MCCGLPLAVVLEVHVIIEDVGSNAFVVVVVIKTVNLPVKLLVSMIFLAYLEHFLVLFSFPIHI